MALTVGELQVVLEAQTANFTAGFKAAQNQVQNFAHESGSALETFKHGVTEALGVLGGLVGAITFERAIEGIGELAAQSQELRNALLEATGSTADANTVFGALREVANTTNQSIQGTVDIFEKLSHATEDLGLSQKDVVDLTETLNNALKLSGKTGDEAQRALKTFSVSIATGKVDIGAFAAALKTVPNLAKGIADGLGITQRELLNTAKAGNLTSEQVIGALQKIGPALAAQAATFTPTFAQALTGIQNEILVVVDAFTNGAGISSTFAEAINNLSKNLAENLVKGIQIGINALAQLIEVGAEVIRFFEEFGLNLTNLGLAFNIIRNNADIFVVGLKNGFNVLRVAADALVVAFNSVRLALGLIDEKTFDASAQRLVDANNQLIASSTTAGDAIQKDLLDNVTQLQKILSEKTDNRLSDGLDQFAKDARTAAQAAVDAVNKLKGARSQLSTEKGPAVAPEQTASDKAEEKAFFERLQRQREIEFRLDEQDRAARNKRLLEEQAETKKRIQEFSDQVGTDVSTAFQAGLQNGSQGFLAGFADSLAQAGQRGLAKGFADAVSDLTDGLTTMLKDLSPAIAGIFGGGKDNAPTLGGQLLGSAFELGGALIPSLISSALKKNDATSAAGNIHSAVTSAQQVRGIVAGPTSIAIADVARGINEAFDEPTRLLGLIERNTRATVAAVRGQPADPSTDLLTDQSESLI